MIGRAIDHALDVDDFFLSFWPLLASLYLYFVVNEVVFLVLYVLLVCTSVVTYQLQSSASGRPPSAGTTGSEEVTPNDANPESTKPDGGPPTGDSSAETDTSNPDSSNPETAGDDTGERRSPTSSSSATGTFARSHRTSTVLVITHVGLSIVVFAAVAHSLLIDRPFVSSLVSLYGLAIFTGALVHYGSVGSTLVYGASRR